MCQFPAKIQCFSPKIGNSSTLCRSTAKWWWKIYRVESGKKWDRFIAKACFFNQHKIWSTGSYSCYGMDLSYSAHYHQYWNHKFKYDEWSHQERRKCGDKASNPIRIKWTDRCNVPSAEEWNQHINDLIMSCDWG